MLSTRHVFRGVVTMGVLLIVSLAVTSGAFATAPAGSAGTWGSFGPVTFGDMAFSPSGALFVSDCGNARIYRVSRSGGVSVFAGSGPGGFKNGFSGDGGPAIDAHFGCPYGLAFDPAGNLYVADHLNNRIRKIDTRGIVSTVVGRGTWAPGNGFVKGDEGKPATQASLYYPVGVSFDAAGNMYIGDREHMAIRKVDTNGIITTVAGTGKQGCSGIGGPATLAGVANPNSLQFGPNGALYITEGACYQVRKIDHDGTIRPVVGTGQEGCSGFNGPALDVQLSDPEELRFGPDGSLFVADQTCDVILRIDTTGTSHLYATAP